LRAQPERRLDAHGVSFRRTSIITESGIAITAQSFACPVIASARPNDSRACRMSSSSRCASENLAMTMSRLQPENLDARKLVRHDADADVLRVEDRAELRAAGVVPVQVRVAEVRTGAVGHAASFSSHGAGAVGIYAG